MLPQVSDSYLCEAILSDFISKSSPNIRDKRPQPGLSGAYPLDCLTIMVLGWHGLGSEVILLPGNAHQPLWENLAREETNMVDLRGSFPTNTRRYRWSIVGKWCVSAINILPSTRNQQAKSVKLEIQYRFHREYQSEALTGTNPRTPIKLKNTGWGLQGCGNNRVFNLAQQARHH